MGRPKTENNRKVVLTLPEEIAMTLDYFVKIQKQARTNSDLVIQLINKLVDEKRNTLNDKDSWKKFIKRIDDMKADKLDEIFGEISEEEEEEVES
ncbi:MAG: hypothetical protein JW776_02630 [Candidatus Lokiarchaeota archaeon]|nr:hypothetical protein [Candidatus Lokiarchaeota archaeon]